MANVGFQVVVQEDIEPGTSVRFDVRVEKAPYTSHELYAQAERDWR